MHTSSSAYSKDYAVNRYSSGASNVLRRHQEYSSTGYVTNSRSLLYDPTKYELKLEILPSRTTELYSTKKPIGRSTVRSPTFRSQTNISSLRRQQAPPKSSYTFTSGTEDISNDIVRPTMRARASSTSRPKAANIGSNYSSHSSRSPSMSPTYRNDRKNDASILRSYESPSSSRRSSNSGDIKCISTRGADKYETYRTNSSSILCQSTTPPLKSKGISSVADHPCKDTTSYDPSFASRRDSSPEPSHKCTASHHADGNGLTGLKNIGNTCFMNSILQCLSNTRRLRDYCLNSEYANEINHSSSMRGKLMKAFSEVIKDLWSGSSTSVTPSSFKSQIQKFSPRFMGYEQQDSQEFLRFLLEGLHEDINQVQKKSSEPLKDMARRSPQEIARETWKWYAQKDKSFIFDLFVGQLESRLECLECGHVSLTFDPFWDLSLSISKSSYAMDSVTLEDCLRNFTREEILDRDEKPMCEKCRVRRRMKKKLSIHRFPKILVIHLKRFNEGSRYRQKLSNLVVFPVDERLKLMHFSSETCEDKSSSTYDLYAVSNHCGSCYGGHYTAYCWNSLLKEWYEYNDSRVSDVSESSVCTKEAYVLFYIRHTSYSGRNSRM